MKGRYWVELLAAGSQFLNAVFAGNRDQTFSARCYEAAVVVGLWRWRPPYWAVNGGAYALRWLLERVAGWPLNWPRNHCRDAFENGDNERTYVAKE